MSAAMKPRPGLTPEQLAEIERVCAEVEIRHELRLNRCDTIPLVRAYRRIKKRPRTAIISRAAQEAVEKRGTLRKFLFGKATK